MSRALTYARVSTNEQAEHGHSLPAQRDRMDAFCISQGWDVAGRYVDDGYSAKDMNRPALQRLLGDAQAGDIIVVYRLDRLTRSVFDLLTLLRLFEQRQAGFRSVSEVYDTTTAMGRLFLTLVAAMAQWERENLAERVLVGMSQAAGSARWLGGDAPYGYRVADGTLVPDPVAATVVQRMFREYIAGAGVRGIAAQLNTERIPGPGGGHWYDATVSLLLRNPAYRGALSWGRRKGPGGNAPQNMARAITVEDVHAALIPPAEWHRAQEVRRFRADVPARTAASIHPLTGILVCGLCGARVSGHVQKRYDKQTGEHRWTARHYRCQARVHRGTCDLPYLPADALEQQLVRHLGRLADPAQMAREMAPALAAVTRTDTGAETEALRVRLRQAEQDAARLDRDYRAGDLSPRAYSRQLDTLAGEQEQLRARLSALGRTKSAPVDAETEAARYADLVRLWPDWTPVERREAVRTVVSRAVVHPGPRLVVTWAWEVGPAG